MITTRLLGIVIAVSATLVGCATPARVEQMVTSGTPNQRIAATGLRSNIAVHDVSGGSDTNPLWKSNVSSDAFEQALEGSLKAVGLWAPKQAGRYKLVAHLENLDQPFGGISMTVTASVRYSLVERSTGREVFARTLSTPYTAAFNAAFLGSERLKIANEGAIKTNITELINELLLQKFDSVAVN